MARDLVQLVKTSLQECEEKKYCFAEYQRNIEQKKHSFDIDEYRQHWNDVIIKENELINHHQRYQLLSTPKPSDEIPSQVETLWLKDERIHHLWQTSMIIRHVFRDIFGVRTYMKCGYFVDRNLCRMIHQYSYYYINEHTNNKLRGHQDEVYCCVASSDGRYLFSGGKDKSILVYDLYSRQMIQNLKGNFDSVDCLDYRYGRLTSGHDDCTVRVFDAYILQEIMIMEGHSDSVYTVEFNQTGDQILSGSKDLTIRLWLIDTGECLTYFIGHQSTVYAAHFFGEHSVISGSVDRSMVVWNRSDASVNHNLTAYLKGAVTDVRINCDSSLVACVVNAGPILILSLPDLELVETIGHSSFQARFHPFLPHLLAFDQITLLNVFDIEKGECMAIYRGHSDRILNICFPPDGFQVVSASKDHTLCVWDITEYVSAFL